MLRRKQKAKCKKFHSLRNQISALFIGMLLLSLLMITVINVLFLEKYYISQKTEVLRKVVSQLEHLDEHMTAAINADVKIENPKQKLFLDRFQKECSRNNLTWVIITKDNQMVAAMGEDSSVLQGRLFGYAYNLDHADAQSTVLEQTEMYIVQQVSDSFVGMDYVESWGTLENGNFFLIRTPLESIQESAAISNRFYGFVGVFMILVSGWCIWILTNRLTKPISELTELSQKMTALEFEARYQSKCGNEIDVLGDNFNRMSEQLQSTIAELKAANIELQKDIEDKTRTEQMRKEFLDNVSHELKTPIALIQGYAEGLKENIMEDQESREFYCDVIMEEAVKMNKLVRSLLTLNQLESGKDTLFMERFDIAALILGVLQKMEIVIQQKEVKVFFEEHIPVYVWADAFKIEEVLTNYVSNALNHVAGEKQIEIKIFSSGSQVRISVFNTGMPIPKEDLPNIWNKFYKVDKARTREYGGSGIGLSIVKAIVESLNQQYGVQNYDNGAEFWFTLDRN